MLAAVLSGYEGGLPGAHAERLPWNKIRSGTGVAAGCVTAGGTDGDGGSVSELTVETGTGRVIGSPQDARSSINKVMRMIKSGKPCLSILLTSRLLPSKNP